VRGRPFADENLSVRAVSYEHEGRAVQLVHLAVASAALARSYSSYICSGLAIGVLQQLEQCTCCPHCMGECLLGH
jgi:hypothetical protein